MFLICSEIIAPNVLGIRRFANPNKGFAKQRPGFAKCGCSEPWERSDLGERNPGGGALSPPERIPFVRRCKNLLMQLFYSVDKYKSLFQI